MTQEQKIIRAKVGLLELAKQLGNVSQACKMMGYSRDSFYRFKDRRERVNHHLTAGQLRPGPTAVASIKPRMSSYVCRLRRTRWGNGPAPVWLVMWPSLRVMVSLSGVRISLLQASSRDDHGAICRDRCVTGKCEHLRC